MLLRCKLAAMASLAWAGAALGGDGVRVYPVDPAEAVGAPYRVTAGGTEVPLERVGMDRPVFYARFQADGPVPVTIQSNQAGKVKAEIVPGRLVEKLETAEAQARFTATGPGPRIATLTQQDRLFPLLFIIYEAAGRPDPKQDVLDVTRQYGVKPGTQPQTDKLQKALDECAGRGKPGVVYVPPGVYLTGTLRIHDNTTLHLAGGAVLKALDDPQAFPVDAGAKETGDSGKTHSNSRLILFDKAHHSAITGHGTLDANGPILRNKHDRRVQVIDVTDSSDIRIEGVVLRNTASWTLHILHSQNVRVEGVKIITDFSVANSDGIDPDSSTDVQIRDVFFYTSDDCIAVKTTGNSGLLAPCRNIKAADCVLMTRKTALKVGTETLADISQVSFENMDVVRSSRGIALWARDGGTISEVTWKSIRMDLMEYPREKMSGQPFYFMAKKRGGESKVRDILVEDVTVRAPWYSLFEADTAWPLSGIEFRNVRLTVTPRTDKKDRKYLFEFQNARDIVFRSLQVDWAGLDPAVSWKGLWSEDAPVKAEDVRKTGGKH